MKATSRVLVPATTRERVDYIECELCKVKSTRGEDWPQNHFEIAEIRVQLREGYYYSEGGQSTATILDICPACFKSKLVPWFEQLGGKVRSEENDW